MLLDYGHILLRDYVELFVFLSETTDSPTGGRQPWDDTVVSRLAILGRTRPRINEAVARAPPLLARGPGDAGMRSAPSPQDAHDRSAASVSLLILIACLSPVRVLALVLAGTSSRHRAASFCTISYDVCF